MTIDHTKLPGARRLAILERQIIKPPTAEERRQAMLTFEQIRHEVDGRGKPYRIIDNTLQKPTEDWLVESVCRWWNMPKTWHKGPPPHVGDWPAQRSADAQPPGWFMRHWNGKGWSTNWYGPASCVGAREGYSYQDERERSLIALPGYDEGPMLWHGYAPDAEGWIRRDYGVEGVPGLDPETMVEFWFSTPPHEIKRSGSNGGFVPSHCLAPASPGCEGAYRIVRP